LRKKALQYFIVLLLGLNSCRFSSFLESRGQPILDLSLYVSSENYTTCTRKAYSEILPWPNAWITPPKLRAVAKKRSQHLGLSSLDINTAHEEVTEESKLTAQIPKSLRKPKETVSSLLGKSTHRNQFRLDAVTSEFFEPLDDLLADKKWLISDTVASVDCLAIGYLALMHAPQLPHDWLRRAMEKKYPTLGKWTAQVVRSTFGDPINPSHALSPLPEGNRQGGRGLPWQAPVRPTITAIASSILDNTIDALPIVSQLRANKQLRKSSQEDPELEDYERNQLAVMATNRNRELYSQIFVIGAGIGTFVGYLFWVGILQLPKRRSHDNGKRDFGAAGAMLGLG
jgi:sorting and assembly machinery component 37